MENEVLRTSSFDNYSIEAVQGRCFVLYIKDYLRGDPVGASKDNVYVCESRYNIQNKNSQRIKNWQQSLPESVRNKEVELELFTEPRQIVKAPLEADRRIPQPSPKRKRETLDETVGTSKRRISAATLDTPLGRVSLI
jgi:chromatin structure-remodeling complex subunit RSC1/2